MISFSTHVLNMYFFSSSGYANPQGSGDKGCCYNLIQLKFCITIENMHSTRSPRLVWFQLVRYLEQYGFQIFFSLKLVKASPKQFKISSLSLKQYYPKVSFIQSNADAKSKVDDFSEFLTKLIRIGILTRFLNKFTEILNCFGETLTNFSEKKNLKNLKNRTIPGIALIETILSGDSLYHAYFLL